MPIIFPKAFLKILGAYQVLKDSPAYSRFPDLENYCINLGKHYSENDSKDTVSLDLGCGPNIRNLFGAAKVYGVDIVKYDKDNIKVADLSIDQIPFKSNYFDFISAHDFIEHVPRVINLYMGPSANLTAGAKFNQNTEKHTEPLYQTRFPFIILMNEVYRVLKSGGIFISITPAYPFSIAFTDPTHVNTINEHTFLNYFTGKTLAKIYGFKGSFELIRQGWRGRYLISVLRKGTDNYLNQ